MSEHITNFAFANKGTLSVLNYSKVNRWLQILSGRADRNQMAVKPLVRTKTKKPNGATPEKKSSLG